MIMLQLFIIIGLAFLILEMFIPVMFFLNFALSAFITAVVGLFVFNLNILMMIFAILALLLLVFVRPIFMNKATTKEQKTGMANKYVGKTAKVIETITASSGAITIYDERWEARTLEGKEIPVGKMVKIIKYDSLIMNVKEEE